MQVLPPLPHRLNDGTSRGVAYLYALGGNKVHAYSLQPDPECYGVLFVAECNGSSFHSPKTMAENVVAVGSSAENFCSKCHAAACNLRDYLAKQKQAAA